MVLALRALYAGLATCVALFHSDNKRREDARAVLQYFATKNPRVDSRDCEGATPISND